MKKFSSMYCMDVCCVVVRASLCTFRCDFNILCVELLNCVCVCVMW